ncbi:MAG TPA: hypothetical protein VJU79_00230 [Candidatus Dormibacteraeota bacterium]|nr:hypothetical protein [Candidatus Dormibacteraeota bacterium]
MGRITHELVEQSAARLREGGWRYTPRQLYYASCAAAETPRRTSRSGAAGAISLGVLCMLLGLIFIANRYVFAALLGCGLALVMAGLLLSLRRQPEPWRVLAMSYPDFAGTFCSEPRDGMLSPADDTSADAASMARPTVICDTSESAACVRANLAVAGLDAAVVVHVGQVLPNSDVVVLHDASPAGCAMAAEICVGKGTSAVDAGLRPRDVIHANLQVIEGAPARVAESMEPTLLDGEVEWLRNGRRVELAVFPPAAVLNLVARAVQQLDARHSAPPAAVVD